LSRQILRVLFPCSNGEKVSPFSLTRLGKIMQENQIISHIFFFHTKKLRFIKRVFEKKLNSDNPTLISKNTKLERDRYNSFSQVDYVFMYIITF
jgi:hypothetical protein